MMPLGDSTGSPRPDHLGARLAVAVAPRYRLGPRIGRGGMAMVFAARDTALDRDVAIKVIDPERIYEEGVEARFRDEAKAAAALRHPHIVAIHAWGESEDMLWFVMDRLAGGSLRDLIQRNGRLDPTRVAQLAGQIAGALQHAHRNGVLHRDVKPANILLDDQHHAYVADFGIAKAVGDSTLTETGAVVGTAQYMSPEQLIAGHQVTAASDQFALGVTMFEMLTGTRPYAGETTAQLALALERGSRGNLKELAPDCPPDLAALVDRMLAPDPADRWPDLEVVKRGAEEIAITGSAASLKRFRSRRTRVTALVGAGTVVAILLVGGWLAAEAGVFGSRLKSASAENSTEASVQVDAASQDIASAENPGSARDDPPDPEAPPAASLSGPDPPLPVRSQEGRVGTRGATTAQERSTGDDSAAAEQSVGERPRTGPAHILVGSRGENVYLYVNGAGPTRIERLRWVPVTVFGTVSLSFRSQGCRVLDETVTLQPGDSVTVGYRNPPCP